MEAHRTASNASRLAAALRSYFRYRATCGDPVGKLTAVILNPVHWKLASLPRALKPDEIERLLNSFTDDLRWPRRGYAIIRCALDMGLRSCEIASLKISDIDWRAGIVTLRGTKSLRQDVLPLPMETGQALVDYLQNERPRTASSSVFVPRLGDHHDRAMTAGAVRGVIRWAYRRIGLTHTRSHALRHAFACRLVENGSSLKEVADLLRHRSLSTTLIYAKLDTPKLAANVTKRLLLAVRTASEHQPRLTQQRVSPHTIRHTTAMHLLQAGVDISVIALWLGHESPATTHHYVEADLTMKERALARLHEPDVKIQRYRAPDSLIDFLKTL